VRFKVVWRPEAEAELANLWMSARDRNRVSAAANRLDQDLAEGAEQVGESREGRTRIVIIPPLAAYFDVIDESGVVLVTSVWRPK
jgi:plasmid stabilization system protein ParE